MKFLARVLLLALLAGCANVRPAISLTRVKLFVAENGWHRITSADLQNAGVEVDPIDARTFQLFRGDQPIATRVQGAGKNVAIDFYGQAGDSPYAAFNVYWLTWGDAPGKRVREIFLAAPTTAPATTFAETARWSPARIYAPQPGDAPSWFWASLDAPITLTLPITLTDAIPGRAELRVNGWGNTDADHHWQIAFNDTRVADAWWNGRGAHAITIALDNARTGVNTLSLIAPGDTRAIADITLLHSIEITYTRRLIAQNHQLEFRTAVGAYRVEGATELFEITNPADPARVLNAIVADGALTFAIAEPESRRWLARDSRAPMLTPRIAPMPPTDLRARDNQADYLIITHPDFARAAQPLAQWRAQRGLAARVITTDEIYDEFNFGAPAPSALRAFLDFARFDWRAPAPRFVLLIGKASYDQRDALNAPNKNLVLTILVDTLNAEKIASDNAFAARSATDPRPAFALGRIPAKTPDQITRVVNKIIAYEANPQADWRARALFVADDKAAEFVEMSDALAARLPPTMRAQKIHLADFAGDASRARADLIARWNDGAGLITYIGHGAIDRWGAREILSAARISEIKNGARLPILFTPTCLDGFFNHPRADSLVEELLFKVDGGIIAGIAPTGVSFAHAQDALMRALWDELFSGARPTLGEALTRAKQRLAVDSREFVEVIATFGLLGDPALAPRLGD